MLPSDTVLVVGGVGSSGYLSSAEQYAPASRAFYAALYQNGKGQRIGTAFVAARAAIGAGSNDLAAGLTLLGNPAARI